MKKILSLLSPAVVACLMVFNNSNAQSKHDMAFTEAKKIANSAIKSPGSADAAEIKSSEVAEKARKDFSKAFNQASNVKWFKVNDGFIAVFNEQGNTRRSNYDQKGNWKYDMTTYTEEKLPSAVRSQVKHTYYDFSITLVNEIRTAEGKMYVVHMSDKNSWINLLVNGEDMDVIEQKAKSE